jgi:flagellar capping protein FliD
MEIDEKKLKEILIEQREEFQRFAENKFEQQRVGSQQYMGVLKEDFDSKLELIGEQYQEIKDTLATHTEMIGALAEDVASIKNTLEQKVDRKEFLGHENRISVLEAKSGR